MIQNGLWNEYTYKTEYLFQSYFQNEQDIAEYNDTWNWNINSSCDISIDEVIDENIENHNSKEKYNNWFYTSSHYSSYLYYCENDSTWEWLSKNYLQFYETESELLTRYPSKTLHESCY
jgi:hypothetical protein